MDETPNRGGDDASGAMDQRRIPTLHEVNAKLRISASPYGPGAGPSAMMFLSKGGPFGPYAWILGLVLLSWLVRMPLLANSVALSYDETNASIASGSIVSSQFAASRNWAERWKLMDNDGFGDARVLWNLGNILWGIAMPSSGVSAFSLGAVLSALTLVALGLAARRMYGDRGMFALLALGAASPMFLNYSVRALGVNHSVAWLSVALYFFSDPRWLMRSWALGGLFLGISFGAHYGVGSVILALAPALAVGAVVGSRDPDLTPRERARRIVAGPAVGAACAAAPLLLLEFWANHAGASYIARLTDHRNLGLEDPGPAGLWLRYLLELDPILPAICAFTTVVACTRSRGIRRVVAGVLWAAFSGLLFLGLRGAPSRPYLFIGLFIALPALLAAPALRKLRPLAPDQEPPPDIPWEHGPLSPVSVLVATVLIAGIFTWKPQLGNLPRMVYGGWPVFTLAAAGLVARFAGDRWGATLRATVLPGMLVLVISAYALSVARGNGYLQLQHQSRRPDQKSAVEYGDFLTDTAYARLDARLNDDFRVFHSHPALFPAVAYEEEWYKLEGIRKDLKERGYDRFFTPEELVYSYVFFVARPDDPNVLPPPGTAYLPREAKGTNPAGGPFEPKAHPWRGLQVRVPGGKYVQPAASSVLLTLERGEVDPDLAGFEYMLLGPNVPQGTRARMILRHEGRQIGAADVPIGRDETPFQLYTATLPPIGNQIEIALEVIPPPEFADPSPEPEDEATRTPLQRFVDWMSSPPAGYVPSVCLYVRRPFLGRPGADAALAEQPAADAETPPSGDPKPENGAARTPEGRRSNGRR